MAGLQRSISSKNVQRLGQTMVLGLDLAARHVGRRLGRGGRLG